MACYYRLRFVYGFRIDEDSGQWIGEIEQIEVSLRDFTEVGEKYAEAMGMDASIDQITFEKNDEVVNRDLE